MKKTAKILRNEEGSVMVVALIIMVLLLVMGISATNMSSIEMQILRNSILKKQEFFFTEGGMVEVATDVNLAGGVTVDLNNYRSSDSNTYAITNIDVPVVLTPTTYGTLTNSDPTPTEISDYTDPIWPVNNSNTGSGDQYAYRVFFNGQGPMPKGYGAGFGSYIFDITVRKQSTDAVPIPSTIINEGFRKIGPKA